MICGKEGGDIVINRVFIGCIAACWLVLNPGLCRGEESSAKTIAFVNAGGLHSELMEQVRSFVETELGMPVRAFSSTKEVHAQTLQDYAPLLFKEKAADDVCLVAFVWADDKIRKHLIIDHDIPVAVVNVRPLLDRDDQKYCRRLQRQAMRGVGFLFGLRPAPDPRCVTHDYMTLAEMDRIGRNFCPPWLDRVRKEAEKRGLVVRKSARPAQRESVTQ